jgi:cytochrome c oxidase subunit 1
MRLRPYSFFFLLALTLALLGYFSYTDTVLDVNVHDTYFVGAFQQFFALLAAVFFGLWVIYALSDRYIYPLHRRMQWIHVLLTIASFAGYIYLSLQFVNLNLEGTSVAEAYEKQVDYLSYAILVFLIGQLMFPLNVLRSVFLRARRGMPEEDFEA